jgi:hypothetical protein
MRKTYLITMISVLLWPICLKADGQKPETNANERSIVESIAYSGFDESKISQPLREEAQKMAGVKYNEQTANGILKKLQDEFPGLNTAYYRMLLEIKPGSKPGMVQVVFQSVPLVIPFKKLETNIKDHEHSIVESIVYNGIFETQISQPLHEEAQKMAGLKFNEQMANGILKKLQDELQNINNPYSRILLKVEQGSKPESVKVVYQLVTGTFPAKKPEANVKSSERYVVESIVYNGIYESKISQPLHEEAQKMIGVKFNERLASGILKKLQEEFPETNNEWRRVLLRVERGSKHDTVKVVFQVVVDVYQLAANVREHYSVETIAYPGIDASKISEPLRQEAQKMIGLKYSEQTANGILKKLREEFPETNNEWRRILLRVERGSKPDTAKVVFQSETNSFECCAVESIAYNGIYESKISQPLLEEARKMIGLKYSQHTASGILKKLREEFPELNNESHQIILKEEWDRKPNTVRVIFQLVSVIFQLNERETNINKVSIVESIEYPIFWESKISQLLREEAQKMIGVKYDEQIANGILRKFQEEFPEINNESHQTILKVEPGSKPDTVKVSFQLITMIFQPVNVNERYIVESVAYPGIDESKISQALRNEAQKMVGVKYNEQFANSILKKFQEEFKNKKELYDISLKVEKGNNPDKVKVVFQFKRERFSFGVGASGPYQSQEGFNGSVGATINELTYHNVFDFKLVSDANTLLERYTGIMASYENKKVGTEKVGLHFDFGSFHEKFNAATTTGLALRPDVSGVYRARESFSPSILLKPFPNNYVGVELSAGLNFQSLEFQTPASHTQMANVAYTSVSLNSCNDQGKYRECLNIIYNLRTATRALDSDFVYTRHFLLVSPSRTQGPHTFSANFSYGWITGTPPLFERFALGNGYTLRGWNKFDVSALGGTHEAHGSLEYRYRHFKVFYDVGTEWDKDRYSPIRQGIGFGILVWKEIPISLAFPIRLHNVKPIFGLF